MLPPPSQLHAEESGNRQLLLPDSIHIDNDEQLGSDKNYSFGIQLGWHGDRAERFMLHTFPIISRIQKSITPTQQLSEIPDHHRVTIGLIAYTPRNTRSTQPQLNDRPFASLLYTGSSIVTMRSVDSAIGHRLVIGALGLPTAQNIQNSFHTLIRSLPLKSNPQDTVGWNHQVSHGGEPTAMYQIAYYQRLNTGVLWMDGGIGIDLQLGYYTEASITTALKIGMFDKTSHLAPFWSMLDRFHPQGSNALLSKQTEIYLAVGGRVRAVAYNELLQGGFRKGSAPLLNASEVERLVYEAYADLNFDFTSIRIGVTLAYRTREHNRTLAGSHKWLGLNIYW